MGADFVQNDCAGGAFWIDFSHCFYENLSSDGEKTNAGIHAGN